MAFLNLTRFVVVKYSCVFVERPSQGTSSLVSRLTTVSLDTYCEAHQMPEMMKQEVLQLEPVLGSYEVCKFSHTFPMEKPNCSLKEPLKVQ